VGPGQHTVELHYAPRSLALGLWISGLSGIGAIVALGWGIAAWLRTRGGANLADATPGRGDPAQRSDPGDPAGNAISA